MSDLNLHVPDESLDLVLERTVDVPRALVWRAWTTPELMERWFTPAPWKTNSVQLELRPGGVFQVTMESPEGDVMEHEAGCILEVVPERKLVWTAGLGPGYRPLNRTPETPFVFSAEISMEDFEGGTKYRAVAMHSDVEGCTLHGEMGFHHGWGAAFDQLVALVKGG